MQKSETVKSQPLHARIIVFAFVVLQVSFELEPQQTLDTFLHVSNNEVMLLDVGNIIKNKLCVTNIAELWIDLDLDGWQFFGVKNIILNEPLCHRVCL